MIEGMKIITGQKTQKNDSILQQKKNVGQPSRKSKMRSQTICKDLSSEMEPKRNKQQRYPAGRAIPLEQRAPSSSIPLEMVNDS
jgi:hypothetical protein